MSIILIFISWLLDYSSTNQYHQNWPNCDFYQFSPLIFKLNYLTLFLCPKPNSTNPIYNYLGLLVILLIPHYHFTLLNYLINLADDFKLENVSNICLICLYGKFGFFVAYWNESEWYEFLGVMSFWDFRKLVSLDARIITIFLCLSEGKSMIFY